MNNRLIRILSTLILSGAICLTLLAGTGAAEEVKFFIQYPNSTTQWIEGGELNDTILDAWDDAATSNDIEYTLDTRPQYLDNLYSINGIEPQGMYWWKVYVNDGGDLTTWDDQYSMTGYVPEDHYGTEHPYVAFVYGNWQTTPLEDPEDCPL